MKTIFSVLILMIATSVAFAGEDGWLTSLETAQAQAKKDGKPILMDFSGSDWCGWCIRLDKEVFSTSVFKDYAKDNLVLLKLDFPRKTAQSAEIKAQNRMLAEKYQVRGFPTIIIVGADGKVLFQTGYMRGGSAAYVEHLKAGLSKS